MYKTYLPSCYLFSYLSIYIFETYFLPNWLPRWNHIQTQLKFIHNRIITGILQWMVWSWVLVHCGQHLRPNTHSIWSIFYRPRYEAEVSFRPKGNFLKTSPLFLFFAPSIPASFSLYSRVGLKLSQECHAPGWGFTTSTLGESPMGRFLTGWKFLHYHPCKMVQNYSCISFLMSAQFPGKMGVMKSVEWWNFALNSLHTQHV